MHGRTLTDAIGPKLVAGSPAPVGLSDAGQTVSTSRPDDPPSGPTVLKADGQPPPTSRGRSLPTVQGYEVLGELGRGGMGVVYRARDVELDREAAVKILQPECPADSPTAVRFLEEARITAQLQHPGIPAVYRVAKLADGRPFLAMKIGRAHV